MDFPYPTSKVFTCLTAIIVVVVEWHDIHYAAGVFITVSWHEGRSRLKLQNRMAEKELAAITSSPGMKILWIIKFMRKQRSFRPPIPTFKHDILQPLPLQHYS
ncbi:hypothetical protein AVEN_71590-1 [Araneus ventricosus]|uniref:Uncharacterized protein n=1 Tax=Araneus ventricosus TaxID=182803 RepID=A0A4Y2M9C6_ARAVE|nr:hypothetical protein AVEN_71590-1 [Araneus ventricosus]